MVDEPKPRGGLKVGVEPVVAKLDVIARPRPDEGPPKPKPRPNMVMKVDVVTPRIPLEPPPKEVPPNARFDLRQWTRRRGAEAPPSIGSMQPPGGRKG